MHTQWGAAAFRTLGFSGCCRIMSLAWLMLAAGCGALHPIKGIPASYLPPEYAGPGRDGLRPINPMLLTRTRPCEHLVDAGDVLTIYIPGILGSATTDAHTIGETPPINFPQDPEMTPTIGFPITVRGDGTISLPQVDPIPVRGMTLSQVEAAVLAAYTTPRQILPAGKERILVSLQRPREYRVLVVREDSSINPALTTTGLGMVNLGSARRGTARIVSLKAYENDVLHALSRLQGVDGLPGLDAEGAIYVIRRRPRCVDVNSSGRTASDVGGGSLGRSPTAVAGGMPSRSAPVLRFQSPDDDYRHGNGYSGHSIGAALSPARAGGRYGAPQTPGYAFSGGMTSSPPPMLASRYGAPSALPANPTYYVPPAGAMPDGWTPAVAAAAGMPVMTSSQVGVMPSIDGGYGVPPGGFGGTAAAPVPSVMPSWGAPAAAPGYGFAASAGPVTNYGAHMSPPVAQWPTPMGSESWGAPPVLPGWEGLPTDDYFQSMLVGGLDATIDGPNVTRIPVRIGPGETPQIRESDIILEDGDIVFIEARESEVFYTGGLIGGGQYTLPRDYDLRALEALSIATAQGVRGGTVRSTGGVSALNQDVTVSASKLIVVRKLPDGTSLPIEVDLNRAKCDMTGRENIIVQPGDYLYLQYSCGEAVLAFIERHLLEGALLGVATAQFQTNGN